MGPGGGVVERGGQSGRALIEHSELVAQQLGIGRTGPPGQFGEIISRLVSAKPVVSDG